jgi:ketosteroid isomerase-like protein
MEHQPEREKTDSDTVTAFVKAINDHHVGRLTALLDEDHRLIDSLGSIVLGKSAVRNAWIEYFYLVPDFVITVDNVFSSGTTFALTGSAEGTVRLGTALHPSNHWRMPSAWRVLVRSGKIVEWQIFADNEPIRKILATAS